MANLDKIIREFYRDISKFIIPSLDLNIDDFDIRNRKERYHIGYRDLSLIHTDIEVLYNIVEEFKKKLQKYSGNIAENEKYEHDHNEERIVKNRKVRISISSPHATAYKNKYMVGISVFDQK